jgi:hypothetical protein
MIVEKRKRIRITKPDEFDWVAEFNFCELSDWEDEPTEEYQITPWPIVLAFALFTGLSAYAIYSHFFG